MNTTAPSPADTSAGPSDNIYFAIASMLVIQIASLTMQIVSKVKKSQCCGNVVEMKESTGVPAP